MVVSVSVGSVKSQSAMGSQPQAINAFDLRYRPLISAAAGALGLPRSAQTRNGCIPARTPSTRSTYRTIKLREPLPEPPRDNPYLRHVARRERALAVARDDNASTRKGLDERGLGVFGQTPKVDARRHGL